ncbi:MAG: coproporphyrinogen III oxidase [Verrucomicrobiales bacterium]|nr:coproporphyrinogen III oxidase [Verrucomicrobiales bacterium]|tara:strand:+ start:1317 stop:2342 length:1026 start_codon:yes stop_codon:yes gene_type:complete
MSSSPQAVEALELVSDLQARFICGLENVAIGHGCPASFTKTEWLRNDGRHGGGNRFTAAVGSIFNRASVNVSQIHYGDEPEKKLGSATAISTIIHPLNPHAPSVHMHISWTEMKNGTGYWRIMGDLNPSIDHPQFKVAFQNTMQKAAPDQYKEATAQGDQYFFIPALNRHRGVAHFYLENYSTEDRAADKTLARTFGESVIDAYVEILNQALANYPEITPKDTLAQLAYHTLYFFQVLTLDRGTTSGLLVHDQNDQGIMASLPAMVDRGLFKSWQSKVVSPQDRLVGKLTEALPASMPSPVTEEVKGLLASTVRNHYRLYPEALDHQSQGYKVPPTVNNHS